MAALTALQRLQRWVEAQGMTQTKLANALGVSQSAVSQWLSGDRVPRCHLFEIEQLTGGEVPAKLWPKRSWEVQRGRAA